MRRWFLYVLLVISAIGYSLIVIEERLANELPLSQVGQKQIIEGVVTHIRELSEHDLQVTLTVLPQQVNYLLGCYHCRLPLRVLQRWRLQVVLKRFHRYGDPGSFNIGLWALSHNVQGRGRIVTSSHNRLLKPSTVWHPQTMREIARARLIAILAKQDNGLILALALGDRSRLTGSLRQLFQNAGVSHLVAISGLHVGLIALLFYYMGGMFWCVIPWLMYRMAKPVFANYFALTAAALYSLLAGFSIPTQRALVSLIIISFVLMRRRYIPSIYILGLTFIAVIIITPLAFLSVSFILSFSAVFLLWYSHVGRCEPVKLGAQFTIGLCMLPLSLLFFKQASFVGFAANIVAIPYVGWVIVPLSLVTLILSFLHVGTAKCIALLTLNLIKPLTWYLQYLMLLPFATVHQTKPTWILLIALIGCLWLCIPRGMPRRWLGVIGLLPMLFYHAPKPVDGEAWITILEVGQGLSAVVQTARHVLLYDTGPSFGEAFNAGRQIIYPYLEYRGIDHIDTLVVSHGDNDHIGGAAVLLQMLPVQQVLTSVPSRFKYFKQVTECHCGQTWHWDGITFAMLAPKRDSYFGGNNKSCVLQIRAEHKRLLLPGDIEWPAEYALTQTGLSLQSNILVAPHHGSRTSSSLRFIKAVKPKIVVMATGYQNRFHLPNAEIVERYQQLGVKVVVIDKTGAYFVKLN